MKQGTTTTFKVKQFDLPDITEIIFSFTNDKNNVVVERTTPTTDDGQIHKSYPSEVSLEDGYYKIGLDQDETLSLAETFYVEAQIMFSGAVTKAYIDKVRMPHTFYTKVISGATTNGEEIELAMELSDVIEINGGSTGDYTDLTNKPRINNIELIGNKTSSQLGLASASDTYTKTETDNKLAEKQNTISGGNGIDVSSDVVSVDLVREQNYMVFTNGKLGLNLNSLGSLPTLRQALVNTSYLYSLASKQYVDNLMSGAVKRLVVESLPQNPDTNTIYMVLKSVPSTNNIYDEYMYINNAWELIGTTEVDLSGYQEKLTVGNGIDITNDTISAKLKSSGGLGVDSNGLSVYVYDLNATTDNLITVDNNKLKLSSYTIASNSDVRYGLLQTYQDGNNIQPKLTAGTNITIDANNVISASGGGSYSGGDGIDITNDTISVDIASGSALQITSGELDVDLSSKQDEIDSNNMLDADLVDDSTSTNKFVTATDKQTWNNKADNTTITTDTSSTTPSLTLADNHEYRYTTDLTSLTLTMPSGDFIASVVFASGSTPTSMTYDSSIKWSGDDITNGQFVPSADKDYDICLYYNGLNVNGIVRGV